jgi:hypothetical protein
VRLDPLCDFELKYRVVPLYEDTRKMVAPFGTLEAKLYGEGDVVFRGERLNAEGRFANHALRRSDGVNIPMVEGVCRTDDGAFLLFSMTGRTLPVSDDGFRRQNLTVLFQTEAEKYAWLNTAVCVLEGLISPDGMRARVLECIHELTAE